MFLFSFTGSVESDTAEHLQTLLDPGKVVKEYKGHILCVLFTYKVLLKPLNRDGATTYLTPMWRLVGGTYFPFPFVSTSSWASGRQISRWLSASRTSALELTPLLFVWNCFHTTSPTLKGMHSLLPCFEDTSMHTWHARLITMGI